MLHIVELRAAPNLNWTQVSRRRPMHECEKIRDDMQAFYPSIELRILEITFWSGPESRESKSKR